MKKIFLITVFLLLVPLAAPAQAYSDLALDFISACRQPDNPFPPEDWSSDDLRTAAFEVLEEVANTEQDGWLVHFCIVTLGYTRNQEDIPKILEYEETMTSDVIRALGGFPAPEAIEFLAGYISHERSSFRERAITGLGAVNFEELDEPDIWREFVIESLTTARESETEEPFIELIDEIIASIEVSVQE